MGEEIAEISDTFRGVWGLGQVSWSGLWRIFNFFEYFSVAPLLCLVKITTTSNYNNTRPMKLIATAFCAALLSSSYAFAEKCEKGKCDKEKEESTLVDCKKCKDKEKEEEETTLAGKCKKDGECDKEKEEATLAGKCKKDGECDKEKEEATLAGKCKKDGECDKEKEEATLAGKCKKDGDCDKDKEEATLA